MGNLHQEQRPHNDAKRQRRFKKTEDWRVRTRYAAPHRRGPRHPQNSKQTEYFLEWVEQKHMDLSHAYIKLATQQNRVALELSALHPVYGKERIQSGEIVTTQHAEKLLAQWHALDARLRWMRHMEKLLQPLFYLSSLGAGQRTPREIPQGDEIIEAFWFDFMEERGRSWVLGLTDDESEVAA